MKEAIDTSEKMDLETVKSYAESWRSLGSVPFNLRHIEGKFSKLLEKLFSQLSLSKKDKEIVIFQSQIDGLLAQNNVRKLDNEQLFIRKKIDEAVKEIQQLENNMSFFSNANSSNPLLKSVLNNIENHKENLEVLKLKIAYPLAMLFFYSFFVKH